MLRFLLRALGVLLLAAAFAALVVDGSRSIAGGRPLFYSLDDATTWIGGRPASTAFAIAWPPPARQALVLLLALPGAPVAGALGLLLLYAGSPRLAGVGFSEGRA